MPLKPNYTKQFDKDVQRAARRGGPVTKLFSVMLLLVTEEPLERHHRDHPLKGQFEGYRDCHVSDDWVLIYKREGDTVLFARTGTHSDLFG